MITWQLDRAQAETLRDWLEYLEDIVEDDDEDNWPMLQTCRAELESLLHQDAQLHAAEVQPELPS